MKEQKIFVLLWGCIVLTIYMAGATVYNLQLFWLYHWQSNLVYGILFGFGLAVPVTVLLVYSVAVINKRLYLRKVRRELKCK